jgi:hypothetical protein
LLGFRFDRGLLERRHLHAQLQRANLQAAAMFQQDQVA